MTGVGGGALMTPLLILLFHVHPITAVGTDLFMPASPKPAARWCMAFTRTIDWRIVTRLAAGSLPASLLTLLAFYLFEVDQAATIPWSPGYWGWRCWQPRWHWCSGVFSLLTPAAWAP